MLIFCSTSTFSKTWENKQKYSHLTLTHSLLCACMQSYSVHIYIYIYSLLFWHHSWPFYPTGASFAINGLHVHVVVVYGQLLIKKQPSYRNSYRFSRNTSAACSKSTQWDKQIHKEYRVQKDQKTCLDKFIERNAVISVCVSLLDGSIGDAAKLLIWNVYTNHHP